MSDKASAQPSRLEKLATKLFGESDERTAFLSALEKPPQYADCLLVFGENPFPVLKTRVEQPDFIARLEGPARPGAHPLHADGAYYCMDYSSVIACTPLLEVVGPVELVIDVCASPGGKTLFAFKALRPTRMIANEVTKSRLTSLGSNMRRMKVENVEITSQFPSKLAERFGGAADVVIVDAPCSGQSLLAKKEKAPGCFHPSVVNGNSNRQKRILAESAGLVRAGGYLLYSTCTYAVEENEDVAAWFMKRHPDFRAVEVSRLSEFRSGLAEFPCYRLFPQSGIGAGSFSVLFQRVGERVSTV